MEKYKSENASYPSSGNGISVFYEEDDPRLVGRIEYPHIIFNNEDGKCGMKVSLEEIVDVWLERVEPERQQTLELEQKTRSEMRELAILREDKKEREDDAKRHQVQDMLKPFLAEQILKVLKEKDLEIIKSNIRSLIAECKIGSSYNSKDYTLEPIGRLFTEREWNTFRENCNKIYKIAGKYGLYDKDYTCGTVDDYFITPLKELRDAPISDWK